MDIELQFLDYVSKGHLQHWLSVGKMPRNCTITEWDRSEDLYETGEYSLKPNWSY